MLHRRKSWSTCTLEMLQSKSDFSATNQLKNFFLFSKNSVKGVIDPTILEPESLKGTLYSKHIEEGIDWTDEKRMEYQKMIRYGKQEAYCIPFTTSDRFMEVEYPKVAKEYQVADTCVASSQILPKSLTLLTILNLILLQI